MKIKNIMLALALGLFLTSCENDDNGGELLPSGDYINGILVANEGPFNNGTGTVTFISNNLEVKEDAIYNKVNTADLGNIVQSIGLTDEKAYIVANVSNKISVVDRFTFDREAEITDGLNNPRYVAFANGKGYVTNWGDPNDTADDFVAIIDLQTNLVEGTIPVDFGPEELVVKGESVYVAHQGGFGQNDKISVIATNTNTVSTTITVGDVPNSMQIDAEGNLWVLCGGKPGYTGEETAGSISKITTTTNEISSSFDFGETEHPDNLSRNGNDFYYSLNGDVYKLSDTATILPETGELSDLSIYAMAAKDDKLYVTDAKDFASNGSLRIYDLVTMQEEKTFEVGIVPGGIYFN